MLVPHSWHEQAGDKLPGGQLGSLSTREARQFVFIHLLGSFQDREDLSGIAATLTSVGWAMWIGCAFAATAVSLTLPQKQELNFALPHR